MSRTIFIFLALALAAMTGCRKDEPVASSGNPVFYAGGTLGAAALDLRAGVNDYYMYSSYSSDAMDIYEFRGELKKHSCSSPCPQSLTVRIRDYMAHSNSQPNFDSSLSIGAYSYLVPDSGYTVNFTSLAYGDSNLTYHWDFGDQGSSTLANPSHTYTAAGTYNVVFTVYGNNMLQQDSMSWSLNPSSPAPCFNLDFGDSAILGDSMAFYPTITGGTAPFTYSWNFGDAGTSTASSPSHNYTAPGNYTVLLTVTDANSCTVTRQHKVATGTVSGTIPTADFSWQAVPASSANYRKVVIEWVDASGNLYTSADLSQPLSSYFNVLSVDEYQQNENGQPTKKLHISADCILYNGSNTLHLVNGDLVFAFAHP